MDMSFWKILTKIPVFVVGLFTFLGEIRAETIYPNVSRFFSNHSYGTLALNEAARHRRDLGRRHAYRAIPRGVAVTIPRRETYCFVMMHYGGHPEGRKHSYEFQRFLIDAEGRRVHLGEYSSTFDIASGVSSNMPSYCFPWSGNIVFFLETFSTDDNWLNGIYEFRVR